MGFYKKLITFLASLIMMVLCFFALPVESSAASIDDLNYEVQIAGNTITDKITITGCNKSASGTLVIPDTIDGYSVTAIAGSAFEGCSKLVSVAIPDSVTTIGTRAFMNCSSLSSVTIGSGVTRIEASAFKYCSSLRNIEIPNGKAIVSDYAFQECTSLTSVSFPNGIGRLGKYMFYGCIMLNDVTLPDSVTSIGDYMFYNCKNLKSFSIGDKVTSIGNSAFGYCTSLTEIDIPDSVSKIYNSAFINCKALKSVHIGNGISSIGQQLFYNCSRLTSITIQNSVDSIADHAFWGCDSLSQVIYCGTEEQWNSITIGGDNGDLTSAGRNYHDLINGNCSICGTAMGSCGDSVMWSLDVAGTLIVFGSGPMTDYDDTNTIPWDSSVVKAIIIEDGVTTIGTNAFIDCTQMTSVTIADSVGVIGDGAFMSCSGLISVTIPDSVSVIGDEVFWDCDKLSSVIIGNGVESIGASAFAGCSTLTSLSIGNQVTSIGKGAFSNCSWLTDVLIPDSVVSIEDSAFSSCASLTSVNIGSGLENLGKSVFSSCTNLSEILVSENNVSFSNDSYGVLYNKDKTTLIQAIDEKSDSYILPETVTTIGDSAFAFFINLTELTIPNGVTEISDNAFAFSSVTKVSIPNTLTAVGNSAFRYCINLSDVVYCGTAERWAEITIGSDNTRLTSANISYHSWINPTCTKPKTCILCGSVEGDLAEHSWNEASCTVPKNCSTCGATEGEALGHRGGVWFELSTATCTQDGIKARICDVCGVTETVALPALGHQGEAVVTPPSCTQSGYTTVKCTICGVTTTSDYLPAIGHNNEAVVTAPTCTEQGYTTNTCTVCGDVTVTDYVDAKGHSWSAWIQTKAPSCTQEGSETRFCNCGIQEKQTIDKTMHTVQNGICTVCGQLETYYWVLATDATVNLSLAEDLYVDLNGYDLSGMITTNGYQVYGMDSTTNTYSCGDMGYFTCTDENGEIIAPVRQFKTTAEMTGDIRRYMAISTDSGYTFHRFYLGITSSSLKPNTVSVGYKAVFYGDDMVKARLDSFGYTMQLDGFNAISRGKSADGFVSGQTLTLRISNYDAENYGETALNASVYMQLSDGTTIQSAEYTVNLKDMVESINANYEAYNAGQLAVLKTMITKNPVMQTWTVDNLYTKES